MKASQARSVCSPKVHLQQQLNLLGWHLPDTFEESGRGATRSLATAEVRDKVAG
jgi:hypothetical protein